MMNNLFQSAFIKSYATVERQTAMKHLPMKLRFDCDDYDSGSWTLESLYDSLRDLGFESNRGGNTFHTKNRAFDFSFYNNDTYLECEIEYGDYDNYYRGDVNAYNDSGYIPPQDDDLVQLESAIDLMIKDGWYEYE